MGKIVPQEYLGEEDDWLRAGRKRLQEQKLGKKNGRLRIAWGISGAGDAIEECIDVMCSIKEKYNPEVGVYLSDAGKYVVRYYRLMDVLENNFDKVSVEKNSNVPFLAGMVQTGRYDMYVIAPATSNTVAKISLGIADTMITNAASMAMKARLPTYIFPVDRVVGKTVTTVPSGKTLTLYIRKEDV
ncbi:MAG: archaeoflavoprotein AfpA [Methermicoccaceae archaeon]